MSKLTIELPDRTYERQMACSKQRRTSVDRLIDQMVTRLLIEADAAVAAIAFGGTALVIVAAIGLARVRLHRLHPAMLWGRLFVMLFLAWGAC